MEHNLEQTAFVIDTADNVATALSALEPGEITLTGDTARPSVRAAQEIPMGHKLALRDIAPGEEIIKYGVVIGCATAAIPCGGWVHLHCMKSLVDERSSHLDVLTGAPADTEYE